MLAEFCTAVCHLAPQLISFPKNGRETAREIEKLRVFTECLIPQGVGAIDGTHFEIICPENDRKVDYYSRKQMYTENTQAIVEADPVFLDIATGFPGSVHDARVLRSTSLFAQAERTDILDSSQELVTQLTQICKTQRRASINIRLQQRVTVEKTFEVLIGTWRCLLKCFDNDLESVSSIVITCCVLHNICQQNHDN